jgi:glycerate kinase
MHILIAPNAFKHSLSALDVALAIEEGLHRSRLSCTCECFPVGDGGDGTGDLIIKKFDGSRLNIIVSDPLGRKINSSFGWLEEEQTAVIEMANASGLHLLESGELVPLQAVSFGTGQQIREALEKGARKIIVGMGGSATVDGGCGMLQALGIRFLDGHGQELSGLPASLVNLATIDVTRLDERIGKTEIIVLCDVDNPLLGSNGSAAIFGPQKGASAEDVKQLDAALARLAKVALQQTGRDMAGIQHGGTAGGAAAGLYALLGARVVNGIDFFLQLTGFDRALERSQLVITGEGSIDEQTLQGKAPFGVASRAKLKGLPVIALAGRLPLLPSASLRNYFDVMLPIGHEPSGLAIALRSTAGNLIRTGTELGNLLALKYK